MPKRRSRRQSYSRETGAEAAAALPYTPKVGRRRAVRRSWLSSMSPTIKTYGIIGIVLVGVATLMFTSIRQSFGSDFEFTMYQGDIGLPSENAQFQDLFPSYKPVVLNFWAGLCPPCRAEMPGFQRVYDEYQDSITLLGLDAGPFMSLGSRGDARRLLNELNITYPTGYAHNRDPVGQFGVSAMPTTIFLTPDGKVFRTSIGFIDEGQLERSIQNLITASATSS